MNPEILRRSYERSAATYDQVFTHQQRPKIEGLRAAIPGELGAVLDVGAGTGLMRRILGGDPVQVDFSRAMLAQAGGRRVLADLHALPFADGTFDTVWSVTALLDYVDAGPAVRSLARVAKPGGVLAISVLKIEDVASLEGALAQVGEPMARLDLGQDIGFVTRV